MRKIQLTLIRKALICSLVYVLQLLPQYGSAQGCSGIAGKVFQDSNYNGVDDDGGLAVDGIKVYAFGEYGFLDSTLTDVNGAYSFPFAPNGQRYRVEFRIPDNRSQFKPTWIGASSASSVQFTSAPNCAVNYGVAIPNNNPPSPIMVGNRVWSDCNGNGVQDPNEDGIGGVTVTLLNANCQPLSTKTTNSNGDYSFENLTPETDYIVVFGNGQMANNFLTVGSKNYVLTSANTGFGINKDENDSDAEIFRSPASACAYDVPLVKFRTGTAGSSNFSYDAGFIELTFKVNAITVTDESCFEKKDGQIVIDAVAQNGTLQYSNTGGQSWQLGNTFNNLAPGRYTIVVRVFNVNFACNGVYLDSVDVVAAPKITAPTTQPDSVCRTERTLRHGGLKATAPNCPLGGTPTLVWYAAEFSTTPLYTGGTFDPIATGYVNPSVAGTTTFWVQSNCGNCSSTRTPADFVVLNISTPHISGNILPCPNETVSYSTTYTQGNSYTWSLPDGGGIFQNGNTTPSVSIKWTSGEGTGPYRVRVVETTPLGCSQITEVVVYIRKVSLICLSNINVSLEASCSVKLQPNMVLRGLHIGSEFYKVQLLRGQTVLEEGIGGVQLDGFDLNGVFYDLTKSGYTYKIIEPCTNTACWGTINFEDKTAPVIVCPANITLLCNQIADLNNLQITGEFNGAMNAQAGGISGSVTECSKYEQFYSDAGSVTACGGGIITRTWTVKDVWGNISLPCTQTITVLAAPVFSPPQSLPTVILECQDVSATDKAAILAGTDVDAYKLDGCGLSTRLKSVSEIATCGNTYKIIRQWEVIDMCHTPMIKGPVEQIIQVIDKTAPDVSITYQNYALDEDSYCWKMYQNGTDMDMSQATVKPFLLNPETQKAGAIIELTPLANSQVCGMADIRFTMRATDEYCSNGSVTYSSSDSRIQFNGSARLTASGGQTVIVTGTIMESQGTDFIVYVTDACGNVTKQEFHINIIDNVSPQVVCVEETRATLGSDGKVRVFASTFNNGSRDNCGIERIHVRRMTKGIENVCSADMIDTDDCFYDYVDFDCSDLGRTDVMVILRAVDAAGNYSDCMVNVTVDDKTKPVCTNQPTIYRRCTDDDINNYKTLFIEPAAYDNCGVTVKEVSDDKELVITCGEGTVIRTWTFEDCAGNTTACTQKLVVKPVKGFTVPRIADQTMQCSSIDINAVMEADKRAILSYPSLDRHGFNYDQYKTCSAPIVETEYWKYHSTEYCQIYRIRYTILDHCDPHYNYSLGQEGEACGIMYNPSNGFQYGLPNANCTAITSVSADGQGNKHIIVYERFIYIDDITPPVSTLPIVPDKCTTWDGVAQVINTGCTFNYREILRGSDDCGNGTAAADPTTLQFTWRVVTKDVPNIAPNTEIAVGNSAIINLTNLTFGKYTICYRLTDLCGNISQEYCYDIEGADCKAPEILVHNKVVSLAGQTGDPSSGMARLTYDDIKNRITDNCDGDLTNDIRVTIEKGGETPATAPSVNIGTKTLSFDCSELGSQGVRVWAVDKAGNWTYALTTITVQDNNNICHRVFVLGTIRTESNQIVNNVTAVATVNGAVVATTPVSQGSFNMSLNASENVQVRAVKDNNDDFAQGVTTFDIAKISQHVLDVDKLPSPYKLIAADVDKSGEIDAMDMLYMRRFILRIAPSLPAGNFRFIDKTYIFRNPSNPFGEDFPEVINIPQLNGNTSANFIAVKLGDVNNTYAALSPRSSRTLTFTTDDIDLVAGKEYTITIALNNEDATAFQGTFNFNGAKVKLVKAGDWSNFTHNNFGIFNNAVTTSWNGKPQGAAEVMTIHFVANRSGKLSDVLSINSALTPALANDAMGNEMNLRLAFDTGKVSGGEFALYQNQPNPMANETTIGFNLPKDGSARLTITATNGKVVKVINNTYKAGFNSISIQKSDLGANGVYYYRLDTETHSSTKKMILQQ
ncbi:MAG: T9SS type A sorting domain-containing protein [Saprospiraceae bacterium]|nr:T9SS type A sorting domain-containing protein [Saprospiraceae bacterium]